nr:hypothetical protein [uncultured Undibacterium sp.]
MKNTLLQTLVENIRSKEIKFVSFDFFDTLVSRRTPRPCDVFYEIGLRLRIEGKLELRITPERFMELRIKAEALARGRSRVQEISLREIYNQFPGDMFRCSIDELMDFEILVEKEMIFPIAEMIDIVSLASKYGKIIVIVSDTYLSSKNLEDIWGKSTPDVSIKCFASSEYGTGKYDDLFNIVLKKLKAKPSQVLHVGDNYHSDIVRPSALGINTVFLPNGSGIFWENWNREATDSEYFSQRIVGNLGDAGITAMRCRTTHYMQASSIDAVSHTKFGAEILGPALSTFVHWVKLHVAGANRTVILPIMREGYIISEMLNLYEDNLNVRPAYLSRRLIFQASLIDVNSAKLRQMRFGNLESTVDEYLGLIGLRVSDVPSLEDVLDASVSNDVIFDRMIYSIESETNLFEKLSDRAREIRRGLLLHINNICSLDGVMADHAIFVDVGWNATIQRLLSNILEEENIKLKVTGLYMMTTPAVNDLVFDGVLAKGLFVDGGLPVSDFQLLSRTLEIFEQACAPNHGSVLGHDHKYGSPIFAVDKIPAIQRIEIKEVQDGILTFHKIFVRNNSLNNLHDVEALAAPIRNILRRAMLMPTSSEAQLFKKWMHDDNLSSGGITPILGTEFAQEILSYKTMQQFTDIGMDQLYWPFGALVLANPELASFTSTAIMKKLPLNYFDENINLNSEMAVGKDFIFDDALKIHQPISKNACGNSYLRFRLPVNGVTMLRWKPASASFDLRLDFILFTFVASNGLVVKHRVDGHRIDEVAKIRGLVKRNRFTWSSSGSESAFYFESLRDLGISQDGIVDIEIAFVINKTLTKFISLQNENENSKMLSLLGLDWEPHIFSGTVNLDTWNGVHVQGDTDEVFVNGDRFSLSGWIIDPDHNIFGGDIYARFTNLIGESQFILLRTEIRLDLAEHFNSATCANAGFSINNAKIKRGKYSLCIVRKDGDKFLIGQKIWNVEISETVEFIETFEN